MKRQTSTQALVAVLSLFTVAAGAQSLADLRNDAATSGDVTTYGMGWGQNRHSPSKQITPANVKRLAPVWNLSLDNSANASSQPLVIGDTMYVSAQNGVFALDPVTGTQKWKFEAAGTSLANVVRVLQFHTDIREFYPVYKVWERRLGGRPVPFSAVEVPAPLPVPGATVLIEAWAYAP